MRPLLPERSNNRSDLFAGTRVLAGLGVSYATVCGVAAGPGNAPVAAVCAILGTGLLFGFMLFILMCRLSAKPLESQPQVRPEATSDTVAESVRRGLAAQAPDPPLTRRPPPGSRRASGTVTTPGRER